MSDVYDATKRSTVMRRVKSRDTSPELKLRKRLWSMGYRYRLHRADLPGKPDICFVGRRVAIFVHGCFWHGHDCKRGARVPKTNTDYWLRKIARNRERDAQHCAELTSMGWRVLTIWECELYDLDAVIERVVALLEA